MEQSIVFSPSVDDRQLASETERIDEELAQVGTDVPVTFNEESLDSVGDGLQPPGVDGGGGGPGVGGAAGVGAVASKIPKPVAGVAASAALPVALAGGVGVSLLGAMSDASARLGTSASLAKTAHDNFFREPGNVLDENIVRPLAKQTLEVSTDFDEIARNKGLGQGLSFLLTGDDPRNERGKGERAGAVGGTLLGIGGGALAGAKAGGALGAAAGSVVPGVGTAAVGTGGAITGAIVGAITAAPIGGRIGSALGEKVDNFRWPELPRFSWPEIPQFSWPTLPTFPGWPDVSAQWGGWPDIQATFPGWPDLSLPTNFWPDIDVPDLAGGGNGGGFDPDLNPFTDENTDLPGLASGGRVQQTGVAEVHRGEIVTDESRLVSELSAAIDGTGGGDTSAIESKLDRLHDDITGLDQTVSQLQRALDVSLKVDKETLGRATNDARRNRMGDTDPTV